MTVEIFPCNDKSITKTLVFSSGLGGHANFWQPQIDFFTQHFQVLCYDQQGVQQDSKLLSSNYQLKDLATELVDILKCNNLSSCHFVGHALGAFIGLEVAAQEPQLLEKLVLLNPWDELDFYTLKCFNLRQSLLEHTGIEAYVKAQAIFLYPPQWISENAQILTEQENQAIIKFAPIPNVLARLNSLKAYQPKTTAATVNHPTLVISNSDDTLVPWQRGLSLTQNMPHAKFNLMATGGHASTVTQPTMMNQTILKFLI